MAFNAGLNFSSSFGIGNMYGGSPFQGAGLPQFGAGNSLFGGGGGFDAFSGSAGMMEGFGGPLGGLGNGFGNPNMGLGGFQQCNPQQLQGAMFMLGRLMGMMAAQGQRGPGMGGFPGQQGGFPGQQGGFPGGGMPGGFPGGGMPGGFPGGGMPGGFPGGPMGPRPMGPMGPMGPQGPGGGPQTIEMQKGSTFTTPSGSKIEWKGDEVKVHENGGNQGAQGAGAGRQFGAQNGGINVAASFAGPGFSGALAISSNMGGMGALGCGCQHAGQDAKPKDWRVWGDPHIDHPNGEKSDFTKKNAIFTMGDGTQIMMGADNPKGVVQKVQIILPGGQPNFGAGYDPNQTSVMKDDGTGKFKEIGTANQFMGGGFGGQQGGFGGHQHGMFA